jgi:choline dehydrogenase-like flavoprotein
MSDILRATYTVIGSGPVGITVAKSLLEKGLSVLLIDGGIELEDSRQKEVNHVKQLMSDRIAPDFINLIKNGVKASNKGVQLKLTYGSDYPYRYSELQLHEDCKDTGQVTPSLAVGGFSNVWGSAVMPYSRADVQAWPIDYDELCLAYHNVSSMLRVSGSDEDWQELLPPLRANPFRFSEFKDHSSTQIEKVINHLKANKNALIKHGIYSGTARLAFAPTIPKRLNTCTQCGLCMYGCPHDIIYSSRHTLNDLKSRFPHLLQHTSGLMVDKIVETTPDEVTIYAYDLHNKTPLPQPLITTKNLFLSAGVLATTRILLKSFNAYDCTLKLKVSEYFILPLLGTPFEGDLNLPAQNTLSTAFFEILDPRIDKNLVHLQLYCYNDLFKRGIDSMFKSWLPYHQIFTPLTAPLLRRLHVIQGYLHSDSSSYINVRLHSRNDPRLCLEGVRSKEGSRVIKQVVAKLFKLSPITRLLPLFPMLSIGAPGEGRHIGGTFPMSDQDLPFTCDLVGRPRGKKMAFNNVYVTDASCFPTIPAPTITLSAMANGHRIAERIAQQNLQQSELKVMFK